MHSLCFSVYTRQGRGVSFPYACEQITHRLFIHPWYNPYIILLLFTYNLFIPPFAINHFSRLTQISSTLLQQHSHPPHSLPSTDSRTTGVYLRACSTNPIVIQAIIPANKKKNAANLPSFTSLGTHSTSPEFANATSGMDNHVPSAVVNKLRDAAKLRMFGGACA